MEIFRTSELPLFWGSRFDLLPLDIVCKCLFNGTGKHQNTATFRVFFRSPVALPPLLSRLLSRRADDDSRNVETKGDGEENQGRERGDSVAHLSQYHVY